MTNHNLEQERTALSAERTYGAWIRTGLAALATGAAARKLIDLPVLVLDVLVTALILFAMFCFAAAVWRELRAPKEWLLPQPQRLPPWLLIFVTLWPFGVAVATLAMVWMIE